MDAIAVELGAGYVSVVPEWEGGASTAVRSLGGAGIGKQTGGGILSGLKGALGPAALTGVGAVAAGALAAGFAAFKIGDSFDEQFDKIRVATGETGAALEGLKGDFKNVLKSVPADFDDAGTAVATLTKKLDIVGKPLEDRASQFLELSRITGTDLPGNIAAGTDALQAWGVAAEYQGGTLDLLFRASQESGASFSDLATDLSENAVTFQELGLSIDDASTLLAGLAKGGIDASSVMPGLNRALATGAKQGKPAAKVYRDLLESIKDAPTDAKAASKAYEVLGARAGPKFAALVRSGKLSFDDLNQSIVWGTESITDAGKDTQDFAEKFDLLKNRVLVGLEPLATRVFDAIGTGMDNLGPVIDNVVGGISTLTTVFKEDGLEGIGRLIEDQAPKIGQKLLDLGSKLYEWVQPQIEPLLGKLGELLKSGAEWIVSDGIPLLAKGAEKLIPAITGWLLGDKEKDQDSALGQLMDKAGVFLKAFVDWIVDTDDGLAGAVFEGGKEAGAALASGIWEGLKEGLGSEFSPFGKGYEIHLPGTNVDIPLGKASGGTVYGNHPYIVGEKGPEFFVPGRTGTIIPNDRLSGWAASSQTGPLIGSLTVQQMPGEDAGTTVRRELTRHRMLQMAVASR